MERCLCFLGGMMTLVVIGQVFCRYVLNHSLFWSEEVARFLLIWLTFLGASVAYYRGMHPGIDVLYSRVSVKSKTLLRFVVYTLSLLFFTVMVYYGTLFAYFVRLQTTPALGLPKWLIFSVVPLSGLILLVHGMALLVNEFWENSTES